MAQETSYKPREARVVYARNVEVPFKIDGDDGQYNIMDISQHGARFDCRRIGASFKERLEKTKRLKQNSPKYYTLLALYYDKLKNGSLPEELKNLESAVKEIQKEYQENYRVAGKIYLLNNPNSIVIIEGVIASWHDYLPQFGLRLFGDGIDEQLFMKAEAHHVVTDNKGVLRGPDGKPMTTKDALDWCNSLEIRLV